MLTYGDKSISGVYTLHEFMAECNGKAAYADNQRHLDSWLKSGDNQWHGIEKDIRKGENHHTATSRLVREGWRKGVEMMEEISNMVTLPVPKTIRRVQRWQQAGDDIEMQKVWNGDLDTAWRGTHRDFRSGPQRVRILIDAIESGGEGADVMRWRGVAALKLADALTEAGYSVQIESVISTTDSSHKFALRAIVKEYTQPVDLLTLAACSALPAFFRSLIHTWGMVVAKHSRFSVGYSVPAVTPVADFKDEQDNAPMFMIEKKIKDAKKASERVTAIIKEIEGE